jgi:hypothetical protein
VKYSSSALGFMNDVGPYLLYRSSSTAGTSRSYNVCTRSGVRGYGGMIEKEK